MTYQHCPACRIEYVASARSCADCGGALQPGPPPEDIGPAVERSDAAAQPFAGAPPPDVLLARLPGQQADYLVRALAESGLVVLSTCKGERQWAGPGRVPSMPLAVTYDVDVYVAAAAVDEARTIMADLTHDGVVLPPLAVGVDLDALAAAAPGDEEELHPAVDASTAEVQAEGTGGRVAIGLVIAAVILLWMLAG